MEQNTIDKRKGLEDFLNGKTSLEESVRILKGLTMSPADEEDRITQMRLDYDMELDNEYGNFLPAQRMAADDGNNFCDFQCETYILRKHGIEYKEEKLAETAKKNYWLSSFGTPLYNIGRMLEANGLVIVKRDYGTTLDQLTEALKENDAIVVVNGDMLINNSEVDLYGEDNPNHAVVVLSVDLSQNRITLYNPSTGNESDVYDLNAFVNAWEESKNYAVLVREKLSEDETYIPHPMDISGVTLPSDLMELTELLAENLHDEWAVKKLHDNPHIKYAPLDEKGNEVPGCNHFLLPYSQLSDNDKKYDIDNAHRTIKLLKRLGYRIVNMKQIHRCPECDGPIELNFSYCPCCGRRLTWEDFR